MTRSASWLAPLVALILLNGCGDDDAPSSGAKATPTSPASPLPSLTATAVSTPTRTPAPSASPTLTLAPSATATGTHLPATATSTPTLTVVEETPEPTPTGSGCCGDAVTDAGEGCDDGNQIGGDGCAANCTVERLFAIDIVGRATIQNASFALPIDLTSSQMFRVGQPMLADATRSCAGGPQFSVGEMPLAQHAAELVFEPAPVPGLVCACVRASEVSRCGQPLVRRSGTDCGVGDDCGSDASICGDAAECRSAHGAGNASSGVIGCDGLDDVNYEVHLDGTTGETVCTRTGGRAVNGSAFLYATTMIGTITDSGTCSEDAGNEGKGPDGIPCTDDDPPTSRGTVSTSPLTTGIAAGGISYGGTKPPIDAESNCGALRCVTSAQGSPFTCNPFPGEPRLCSASNAASQPMVGDLVITTCYEPRPMNSVWEGPQRN